MKEIEKLREEIDIIDTEIVRQLSSRMDVVLKIRELKKKNCLPLEDLSREEEIISKLSFPNLDETFIRELYHLVFNYSKFRLKDTSTP